MAGYPDLIAAFGTDEVAARNHYEMFGRAEGRDPFRFDPIAYSAANGDLLRAFGTDARALSFHYLQFGFAEGRTTTFGAYQYAASYGDLRIAMGSDVQALTQHYVRSGFAEGRTLSFDSLRYAASHPDVYRAVGSNPEALARHYVEIGAAQGRTMTFEALSYVASHADLLRAFGTDVVASTRHYLDHGIAENRAITFDPIVYAATYPDLIRAYGADRQALAKHFVEYGFSEGRSASFDAVAYAAANPDVDAATGGSSAALALHYVQHGLAEGRFFATLIGTSGDDQLRGTAGNDVIAGRGGNDLFVATAGNDRYLGGDGIDSLDTSELAGPVTITRTIIGGRLQVGDKVDSFESVERFFLGSGNDFVDLDGGRDTVYGGAGSDQIFGRGGGDDLHGGAGDDVVSAFTFEAADASAVDRLYGDEGADILILGDRGGEAYGGADGDQFIIRDMVGDARAVLNGGSGQDTVSSSFAGDVVVASDGNTYLLDRATGAIKASLTSIEYLSVLPMTTFGLIPGTVNVIGQGGSAFSYFASGSHNLRGEFKTTSDGYAGFQLGSGHQEISATFTSGGRLFFSMTKSTVNATILGDADIEFDINTSTGPAFVRLGDGDDRFVVRSGTNTLDGGGGNDTLWLLSETAVSIDLVRGEARSNDGIAVTFQRIENAIGGEANDTIIGNDEANVLRGYNGDDRIYGGGTGTDGRFDILMGGPGNDILVGGAGYDSLRGDAGDDLLVDRANGSLSGHEGNDVLVALLDDPATAAFNSLFVNLGAGADTLVISAAVGTFANIRVSDFNLAEGDRLDLSNLRDLNGQVLDFADVMGAMASTAEGLQLDLSQFRNVSGASLSGQVIFTSLSQPSDVGVGMFVFENGMDWRSPLPTDWLL
ncbi:calcium-binding protein [Sphingomonas sp. LY160]|uniref:calcium-binding protein n=1 Tax=Sphingomonas sp. LY160 TaxID=3095342 RepID=UPI002ADEB016|nr:calcium-binding protein [Sphingomonas sp. LY160]MEA1072184.1 calcium-binding protein [Sphingomonas sp. LY160]